jgi:hypothetical protein
MASSPDPVSPHSPASGETIPQLHSDLEAPLIIVLVGADPAAEVHDRPIARALCEHINRHAVERGKMLRTALPAAICLTDVWYLNSAHLRLRPAVSVGGPEVNAASAMLATRLPAVLAVEGRWAIHASQAESESHAVTSHSPLACCWGRTPEDTLTAVERFAARHLDGMLDAAIASLA